MPSSLFGLLCRHLLIPLMSAERAWATAMELKSEMQDQASAGPAIGFDRQLCDVRQVVE